MKTNKHKQKLTSGSILLIFCQELFNGRSWSAVKAAALGSQQAGSLL